MSWASAADIPPTYTSEPSMSGANRAPSSFVKNATEIGRPGVIPRSRHVWMTSSPASTPKLPSYLPPVRTVSMCEPVITAGPVPTSHVPMTFPTSSVSIRRPRSRIQPMTRSRPARSSSVRARRLHPPPSILPTSASSMIRLISRSALIRPIVAVDPVVPVTSISVRNPSH